MVPAIVYPYKRQVPEHIIKKLPPGFCVARSDTGWMTSQVFFEYMANIFISDLARERRQLKGLKDDEKLILNDSDWTVYWLDGYSSHLTMHTSKLCDMNKVLLFCFKPHSSHVCQPNDVGPFKPLKSEWKAAMDTWRIDHPYTILSRAEFGQVLSIALDKLNAASIISGYRATGLYPYNPDAVHYEKLTTSRYKNARTDESTSENDLSSCNDYVITLRNIEEFLGSDTVSKYNEASVGLSVIINDLPAINAYLVWLFFKRLASDSASAENDAGTENAANRFINLDLIESDFAEETIVTAEGRDYW
jgi:hypothetical protein